MSISLAHTLDIPFSGYQSPDSALIHFRNVNFEIGRYSNRVLEQLEK